MSDDTGNNKTCFVICPIGDEGTEIRKWSDWTFNYVIKPTAERYNYFAFRADHIKESGMITIQIIEQLLESDLIVADLTDNNPNVFYELAIRHFTQKPYIQMIKSTERIPFDINGMRTIFFDPLLTESAENAKAKLSEQIELIERGEFKAANPITLARNFLIIQETIEKNKIAFKENDISNALLESINQIISSISEIKSDLFDLKKYTRYNYSKSIGFPVSWENQQINYENSSDSLSTQIAIQNLKNQEKQLIQTLIESKNNIKTIENEIQMHYTGEECKELKSDLNLLFSNKQKEMEKMRKLESNINKLNRLIKLQEG